MKKSDSQKMKLGIFVVLGTILLIVGLYYIGNNQSMFSKNIKLHAQFSNVNGLQLGNNVRYSGINVGTISKIEMDDDALISVEMTIDQEIASKIKKNAIATIGSDGLVGSMLVNIIPQNGDSSPVITGDTIETYSKIGTDEMLNTLNLTNENAALLTNDLLEITTQILKGQGTIGVLMNDSVMADDLKATVSELRQASAQTSMVLSELTQLVSSLNNEESVLNVLLNDTATAGKIKGIVGSLEKSSVDINAMTKDLVLIIENVGDESSGFSYLMNDSTFVEKVDTTLINLKEGTAIFNESMEALKHNILFRRYFKKQEKNKAKEENN